MVIKNSPEKDIESILNDSNVFAQKINKYCRNCNNPTPDGLAYCNQNCKNEFEIKYRNDFKD